MRARRVVAWTALPLSVALLASACGGGGEGETGTGGAAAGPSDTTISIYGGEPENPLVPGNTTEVNGSKVIGALFTGLVEYDPQTAEPRNAVAASIDTTDSRVYTIALEEGWTFHDGTPVTASSFVDAWNYTAHAPNAQSGASFFTQVQGFADVNPTDPDGEAGPQPAPAPTAETMSGLRVIDDRTFEVTLTEPFSVFPTQLGYDTFSPLPESFFADPAAFEANPIGNGPFRYVSRQPGVNIVVERYDQFGGDAPANIGGIEFRAYESTDSAYADVVSGNLDFLEIIPPSATAGDLFEADLPGRSLSQTYLGIQTLAFPMYDARYQDVQLRQSISMAIDREAVNQQIFSGRKPPADGFVPPNVPGRAENQCGELCTFQPDRARQMFEASGFQGPIQLTSNVDAGNEEWMRATCVTITNALGRPCEVVPVPTFAEFLTARDDHTVEEIFRTGWVADYPSIENFLNPLYRTAGSSNDGLYSNPAVDELLVRADGAPSEEEGHALYQEAERLIIQDMPAIPLYFQSVESGWSERLSNVTVTPFRELDLASVTATE
jgi:oligopeptide transport system substrate-binding protein